jgi:salicylate hydroxylase
MKALVVGGGIGGLAAALSLHHAGLDVEVHEKSPVLAEVGAGVQVSPNGVKVLHRLGLLDELRTIAFEPEALEMRMGDTGTTVFSIPIKAIAAQKYGAPYFHVHRADLHDLLARTLQARVPSALHVGHAVEIIAQGADGVEARFTDGSRAKGDVLIGADGIHSVIRRALQGDEHPRFTGNVAWRLVVPATPDLRRLVPPNACIWVGPGRHAVTYYLRRGELVNFVGVVERDNWREEGWTQKGSADELRADFAGFAPPVAAILEQASDCYRWALHDRDPMASWSAGRATLLGDACHPMLPFLAQGAVMAIEDGWVLARCLSSGADPAQALLDYEAARKPRTARVQMAARAQMGRYHQRSAVGKLTTYGPMWLAGKLLPGTVNSMQDWLYAFDVTSSRQ